MFKPYVPCDECKQPREVCDKCSYKIALINYDRAFDKVRKLSDELNKPLTILV